MSVTGIRCAPDEFCLFLNAAITLAPTYEFGKRESGYSTAILLNCVRAISLEIFTDHNA